MSLNYEWKWSCNEFGGVCVTSGWTFVGSAEFSNILVVLFGYCSWNWCTDAVVGSKDYNIQYKMWWFVETFLKWFIKWYN